MISVTVSIGSESVTVETGSVIVAVTVSISVITVGNGDGDGKNLVKEAVCSVWGDIVMSAEMAEERGGAVTMAVSTTSSSDVTTLVTKTMLVDVDGRTLSEESRGIDRTNFVVVSRIIILTAALRLSMERHNMTIKQGRDRAMR